MKTLKMIVILIFLVCLFGCAFEENQEIEKKITVSVNNFHSLFNQEKFNQIYSEADEELKNTLTEQEFVSYLEIIKKNDIEKLNLVAKVWIKNQSNDGLERILFKKTKFFNTVTIYTKKDIYVEHFEWNLTNGKAKLVSYFVNKASENYELIID